MSLICQTLQLTSLDHKVRMKHFNPFYFSGDCPKSMKYNECGSACTATCTEQVQACIEMCVPRCECPRDAPILLGNSCVPANE